MDKQKLSSLQDLLVRRRADQFAFLGALVRQPSENTTGEFKGLIDFLAGEFRKLGLSVQFFPDPGEGRQLADKGLVNLVVRHEFDRGPTIALVTHVDTSLAGPDWTHDPFGGEIVDRHMYGRGVAGGKGALAAYVFALIALCENPDGLLGAVELHITFDGETGGDLGARWLLANKRVAPDMVIASGTTYNLITSASGRLCLEAEINGRSAPASNPKAGVDTMDAAARVMTAVYNLRQDYARLSSEIEGIGSPSIIITEVHGGESSRHVAARTIIKMDRRMIPEEDPVKVERDLTTLIGTSVVGVKNTLCKVRRTCLYPAMIQADGTDRLITAFQRHAPAVFGETLPVVGTAMETDGRHYTDAGIPTVLYGVGPADLAEAAIAGPDEVLALDDLRRSTELLVYTLSDLLSGEADNAEQDDM